MTVMVGYPPVRRFNGTRRNYDCVVTTVCQECAVGCGLQAYVSEGRLVDVQGDEKNPVNEGRLCACGTAFARDLYDSERIAKPAERKSLQDNFEELAGWEEALDSLADRLKRVRDQNGPEALCIECDPAAGLDFYLSAMRFAALWGTPCVFSSLGEPQASNPGGLPNAPDGPCSDWIHSRSLLIVGADPAMSHPVAFRWVLEAQKNGAKIIVADTRFTKTMAAADVALRIRPDSGNVLGTAIMKAILDNDLCGLDSIGNRLTAAESWQKSFDGLSLENVARTTGLSMPKLTETAFLLAKKGPVQLVTGKPLALLPGYGIWRTIAAAMDWSGKKGGGWYPVDSGRPPLSSAEDLKEENPEGIAKKASADLPLSFGDFLSKAIKGQVAAPKAIICSGNCLRDVGLPCLPGTEAVPFTAYFGLVSNETSKLSNMLFPAQAWAERDGLFFNNDRAIQWGRKIVEPPDTARSGLDFWMGLAKRLGWDDRFPWKSEEGMADHEAFGDWVLNQNSATKGCKPELLRNSADKGEFIYWPFSPEKARQEGAAQKVTPTPASTVEEVSDESDEAYPLYLEVAGAACRVPIPSDSGATTNGYQLLQINPETARALGIETGDEVLVEDPVAVTEAQAWVTRVVPPSLVCLQRGSKEKRALVCKKGQSSQEALNILKEMLS